MCPRRGISRARGQGADHVHGVPPDARGRDQNNANFSSRRLGASARRGPPSHIPCRRKSCPRPRDDQSVLAQWTAGVGAAGARRQHADAVLEDERRTVHAPLIPAEGVRVEPYEAGQHLVGRAGLAKLTSPATPATPADQQRAEESMPEPAPSSPQVEPEPLPEPEPARRGPPEQYDWDEGFQFMRRELDKRGDPKNPINAVEGWRSDADVARLVAFHIALPGGREPDPKHTARVIRSELKKWRAEQRSRN